MIFIDTEFNKNIEILSLGITTNDNVNEFYFLNDPRDNSFKIHGLTHIFLKEHGLDPKTAKQVLFSHPHDVIVGYDIDKDLSALNLSSAKMFANNKIIDLKLIISMFGINPSLETFAIASGILEENKNTLPIHTSSMDSFLLKKVYNVIVDFLKEKGFDETTIISDFLELSRIRYFKEEWNYFELENKYLALQELFYSLNLKEKKVLKLDFTKIHYSIYENVICLYDSTLVMFAKYKKEHFEHKYFNFMIKINLKHEYNNIGFKNYNIERLFNGRII